MRVLKKGLNGEDVVRWQNFLVGQGLYHGEVDGDFGSGSQQATIDFQRTHGLTPSDGIVGNQTLGVAMQLGLTVIEDPHDTDEFGANYPPAPNFSPLVTNEQRQALFGTFTYVPAPTAWNREAIKITNSWAHDNIIMVDVPQLAKVGFPVIAFHKLVAHQLQGFFKDLEEEGLLDLVLSFDGSYVPRFVRGSTTYLSNHSWGTALDLNARWNPLGASGALVGQPGSIRRLIPTANRWGFYAGLHFAGRPDAMHFEIAVVLTE